MTTGRLRGSSFHPEGTMEQTLEISETDVVETEEVLEEELLVEEISIDGMCGVY
jgi:mycofactocin precursor